VLSVVGLRAGYQASAEVLRGLDLELADGETTALMGRNGMGKSTLLKAVMGHLRIAAGQIRFLEHELVGRPPFAISNLGIAWVPQGREIFADFTVEENLLLGVLGKRALPARVPERIYAWFPVLAERRRQRAGTMSGGEQQQLAIARALLSRPRLLLLDEPSLGLAPVVIDIVFDALEELRREGVTILLVEQNAARAVEFADRAYILRSGRVAHSGTRDEIMAMEDFETAYLGV
jgi:ABC-type branched-subunit amino acid transport system ATPase component